MRSSLGTCCVFVLVFGGAATAWSQPEGNCKSVLLYGVELVACLDKYEYGASEKVRASVSVINGTEGPIAIPQATKYCALWWVEEEWCNAGRDSCVASDPFAFCLVNELEAYRPGVTEIGNGLQSETVLSPVGLEHVSGVAVFRNPWNVDGYFSDEVLLTIEFSRAKQVTTVQGSTWSSVKRLYR